MEASQQSCDLDIILKFTHAETNTQRYSTFHRHTARFSPPQDSKLGALAPHPAPDH
jgi:hypothetical protein